LFQGLEDPVDFEFLSVCCHQYSFNWSNTSCLAYMVNNSLRYLYVLIRVCAYNTQCGSVSILYILILWTVRLLFFSFSYLCKLTLWWSSGCITGSGNNNIQGYKGQRSTCCFGWVWRGTTWFPQGQRSLSFMYLVVEGTYPLNFLCKAPSVYRIARELWTPMYSLLNQLDFP
jgi:hypothetical protein